MIEDALSSGPGLEDAAWMWERALAIRTELEGRGQPARSVIDEREARPVVLIASDDPRLIEALVVEAGARGLELRGAGLAEAP